MGPAKIEGLKQGLKYAFGAAALFEGLEMLHAASLHLQPLPQWEIGMILGVGAGISGYVADHWGEVQMPSTAEMQRNVEQSDGKVTYLHNGPPGNSL